VDDVLDPPDFGADVDVDVDEVPSEPFAEPDEPFAEPDEPFAEVAADFAAARLSVR
jgi:hypothetical protein